MHKKKQGFSLAWKSQVVEKINYFRTETRRIDISFARNYNFES